jgi:hypothetical protein
MKIEQSLSQTMIAQQTEHQHNSTPGARQTSAAAFDLEISPMIDDREWMHGIRRPCF